MYDEDILLELQDINYNLQSFIQQENNNNDYIVNSIDSNSNNEIIYLGCIILVLFVFNLIHLLPTPKRPLRRDK